MVATNFWRCPRRAFSTRHSPACCMATGKAAEAASAPLLATRAELRHYGNHHGPSAYASE